MTLLRQFKRLPSVYVLSRNKNSITHFHQNIVILEPLESQLIYFSFTRHFWITFSAFHFQMPNIGSFFVILFVMINCTGAFSSVSYTSDQCILACRNLQFEDDAMICRKCSNNPPTSYRMCKFACDSTGDPRLYKICQKCVNRVHLTPPMCMHACDSTSNRQYWEICKRCQENPPITGSMCIHACDNTAYAWYGGICDSCLMDPPPALCRHACQNTAYPKYRQICYKRVCS